MHPPGGKSEKFSIWDDIKRNDRAYLMAVAACWGGVFLGWTIGMIGGILPRESFKKSFGLGDDPDTYANLTGWIVVIGQLGCCIGALITAHLSDHYGRKRSLVIGAIIFLCGSILQVNPTLYSSTPRSALTNLNIGRAIGGFGVGITSSVIPSYISESSPSHLRGRLTGMYQLFTVFGIASSFWVNYGLLRHFGDDPDRPQLWQIAFGIQMIPGCLLLYFIASQYESPRWLAEQGRFEEARHVVAYIRGVDANNAGVQEEIQAIKKDVQGRGKLSIREQAKEATSSRKMLYRCSIPVILMAFQQLTGINAVNYYSPAIFKELGLGGASAGLLGTGIYGIVKIIATVIALVLGVEQWGRKAMLVWGGLGQAACMLFIGGYLAFHGDGGLTVMSYFAILTLYLYIISFSFGWSVAPWPAMAEAVPNHLRSLTIALGMMANWFFNILISKITPLLLNSIPWGTFVIFGITTLGAVAWAMLLFPETGGYAIEDIHKLFDDVVKQSLHDNRWLLQRPPVRKPSEPEDEEVAAGRGSTPLRDVRFRTSDDHNMAKALAKKTASDNEKALQNLRYGMIISSALYVLLRFILPPHKFPPAFWPSMIYLLTAIPTVFLYRYLHSVGTPKRDAAGTLISSGDDLNQPGLLDACWDVIYVTWGCQVGSSLFGEWFWWLYLSIPLFGGYKVYTSFISPMMGLRQGHPAAAAADPAAASSGADTTSKRQAKIQKRNEKIQAQQAKSGRR